MNLKVQRSYELYLSVRSYADNKKVMTLTLSNEQNSTFQNIEISMNYYLKKCFTNILLHISLADFKRKKNYRLFLVRCYYATLHPNTLI